ncbi:putative Protein sphX [Vibrio nigripulchritudo SFn27]|uniref:Phosphate-binding protein n=1 Tax=Vibrio nigripulchritudo TaxID=28173 RepID=A0A9P1NJY8_9VIBR|nr:PstS family phosphate ABC transporter substrate-binding protein [Vibrio nigripulchritudo]CCN38684.1 putative Protein sphX [Vibrio nigripulchritudo AM115]CCN44993.1 putative Protein sphX [Vibrio nigripulchritudo FTn2]CCN79751.1 putative Protein sphX [Vibrio nigripulchritudo SO65]CCO44007.1 putative Protein sphX [Vibrio nigripulchritudo SFn135]CBJ93162.1 Putative protein sphX precursor [Vibrio nigripulchritudo]
MFIAQFFPRTTLSWFLLAGVTCGAYAKDLIKIEGSSTVYPITHQIAERYMLSEGTGTQVVVGISGTGGGFRKFCRGRTDVSNASRPMKANEKALCQENSIEYIELPVALDAITIVVNRNNDWLSALSLDDLKLLWEVGAQNSITTWRHLRPHYPAIPINLHGPGMDSGTYDYFVDVTLGGQKSRQDYRANEDDEAMVAEVAEDKNAMAFLGFAYYLKNQDKLKAVAISERGGVPTLPSVGSVTQGQYGSLSRPLFIYVNKTALEKRGSVRRFLELYFHPSNINGIVTRAGYIPLSSRMYSAVRQRLKNKVSGSVFDGHDMHDDFERFLVQQ